jgi:hypothetical protein
LARSGDVNVNCPPLSMTIICVGYSVSSTWISVVALMSFPLVFADNLHRAVSVDVIGAAHRQIRGRSRSRHRIVAAFADIPLHLKTATRGDDFVSNLTSRSSQCYWRGWWFRLCCRMGSHFNNTNELLPTEAALLRKQLDEICPQLPPSSRYAGRRVPRYR